MIRINNWLLATALLLSSCGAPGDGSKQTRAQTEAKRGVLLLGNAAEPPDLDPHIVTGVPEILILSSLFEGLVTFDPKTLEPRAGVAESWTVSSDGKEYVFTLRADVRWSNGDPLLARDFLYAWRRALLPELGAMFAYALHPIENARRFNKGEIDDFSQVGIDTPDERTLRVRLEAPSPTFLSTLILPVAYPVHQGAVEKHGPPGKRATGWTRPGEMIGNGPFLLSEWKPDEVVRVARNAHYWDAASVRLNEIHFFPIGNLQTEERLFRTGGLHATANISPHKVETYRRKKDTRLRIKPYLGTYFYRFNTTRKPFDDRRVRQAFALAIDRESIARDVLLGVQRPASSLTPPDTAGYTCRASIVHDIEKARALLAAAGYPNGEGFPPVEFLYNTSDNYRMIAEATQSMWQKTLGVRVGLVNQDWKVYLSRTRSLDYDISRGSWIADYVDPSNFLEIFLSGGGNNNTGFASAQYDELLTRAARTLDRDQRFELFQEAERLLLDAAPLAPIYHNTRVCLQSPLLRGWESNPLDYVAFKDLYFDLSRLAENPDSEGP